MHAYVLMANHYHLLLETPEPNLSVGMGHASRVSQAVGRMRRARGRRLKGLQRLLEALVPQEGQKE